MAVGRRFEEALQKALRMVDPASLGFDHTLITPTEEVRSLIIMLCTNIHDITPQELVNPTDKRIFAVAAALGDPERWSLRQLHQLTRIDPWFLSRMNNIVVMATKLRQLEGKVRTYYCSWREKTRNSIVFL